MEDIEIIELFWSRDESAISETDKKYGRLLHRIAGNILSKHEDAEESVSDTYNKAWNTMPPQRPKFFSAYLGRITRNNSINYWYKNRAQKRDCSVEVILSELNNCIPSTQNVEEEIETMEITKVINSWLHSLSQDDRVLFMRRYWYGDAVNDLAVECGITPNKLAGRIYRLRQKLRNVLEREGIFL